LDQRVVKNTNITSSIFVVFGYLFLSLQKYDMHSGQYKKYCILKIPSAYCQFCCIFSKFLTKTWLKFCLMKSTVKMKIAFKYMQNHRLLFSIIESSLNLWSFDIYII